MKALSIQQPWAYCITHGTKRVENRTWYAHHRGLLLLHAGKRYQTGMDLLIHRDSPEVDVEGMRTSPRGAIVGVCRLIDCIGPGEDARLPVDQRIWSDPEQFKFLLADVRAFAEPIPYKGALSFFDIPDAIVAEELRRLAA
jgi:ASCH domain